MSFMKNVFDGVFGEMGGYMDDFGRGDMEGFEMDPELTPDYSGEFGGQSRLIDGDFYNIFDDDFDDEDIN